MSSCSTCQGHRVIPCSHERCMATHDPEMPHPCPACTYKTCSKCGKRRRRKFFTWHPRTKDRRTSWCRECKAQGMRDMRERIKDEN